MTVTMLALLELLWLIVAYFVVTDTRLNMKHLLVLFMFLFNGCMCHAHSMQLIALTSVLHSKVYLFLFDGNQ